MKYPRPYCFFLIACMGLLAGCRSPAPEQASCCPPPGNIIGAASTAPVEKTLPGDSIYHLDTAWRDEAGGAVSFSSLGGSPRLLAMFFSHCEYACPILIGDLKKLENGMTPEIRKEIRFTLASFDTERDTPEVLKAYGERMLLSSDTWRLLHGDKRAVRSTAAVLGVRYRPEPGGGFAHENKIFLVSPEGRILHTQEGLGADPGPMLDAVRKYTTAR